LTAAAVRSLTAEFWSDTQDVFEAILAHPFIAGLTSGELDLDCFHRYVVQDTHYLRRYAHALRVLAARAPDDTSAAMFGRHATNAIAVEQALHAGFLRELADLGAHPVAADGEQPVPTPTTLAYTSYLLAITHGGSFAEGLAAVLPCYWVYWEVGKALVDRSSPNPLYARWISTYGGDEFGDVVRDVLSLADRVGQDASTVERARMREHYRVGAHYEWMFWDAAYRNERWPL
jgi:thiaminase (transcriptional activator TenA)